MKISSETTTKLKISLDEKQVKQAIASHIMDNYPEDETPKITANDVILQNTGGAKIELTLLHSED